MAEHSINFIYLFFTFLLCTIAETHAKDIKERKAAYKIRSMDEDKICSPLPPLTIANKDLIKNVDVSYKNPYSYPLLVYPGHALDNWRGLYDKECKFSVKTAKKEGLFVVIQSMNLRREGDECLDYIRFTPENSNTSEKFCGFYERIPGSSSAFEDEGFKNGQDLTPKLSLEEFSLNGKITTEIFISKKPLNSGDSLNFTITYTPFKECNNDEIQKSLKIFPNRMKCINSSYVCDGYTNCVSSWCYDEDNTFCSHDQVITIEGYKTLTLTAVTSTFLCFIIFMMCLYICRKHEKLCWSSDWAGPTDSNNISGLPMDRGAQSSGNRPYVSTAPMLEVAVPSVHDKDLPPSYDSLFPPQAGTAST